MVHFDGVLLLFSTWLALATFSGVAGASFLLYNSFFLLLRDPLLWLLGKMRFITSMLKTVVIKVISMEFTRVMDLAYKAFKFFLFFS